MSDLQMSFIVDPISNYIFLHNLELSKEPVSFHKGIESSQETINHPSREELFLIREFNLGFFQTLKGKKIWVRDPCVDKRHGCFAYIDRMGNIEFGAVGKATMLYFLPVIPVPTHIGSTLWKLYKNVQELMNDNQRLKLENKKLRDASSLLL